MKKTNLLFACLTAIFAISMSLPFIVPHTGFMALFGFLPLLIMDRIATLTGYRHFWIWHYLAFVLWNAATTFWVCNATVGGGLFGFLGMVLGVPAFALIYYYIGKFIEKRLKKKELPVETSAYQEYNKYDIDRKDIV